MRIPLVAACTGTAFAALLCGSLAASAAIPTSPAPGATTSSHPVFTWALGPSEESDTVHIANRPEVTPDGQFHSENVVMTGALIESAATTWSPTEALFAGRYWWNVETRDAEFLPAFSTAREFTVGPEIQLLSVRLSRSTFIRQLAVDVRWVTNVRDVAIELRFSQRRRMVGVVHRHVETLISREPERASLQWRAPRRVRPGTRLVARIRITGAGGSATVHRPVTAP